MANNDFYYLKISRQKLHALALRINPTTLLSTVQAQSSHLHIKIVQKKRRASSLTACSWVNLQLPIPLQCFSFS